MGFPHALVVAPGWMRVDWAGGSSPRGEGKSKTGTRASQGKGTAVDEHCLVSASIVDAVKARRSIRRQNADAT